MSEPERPGQSEFILTAQRLHAAQLAATTPEEREAADHDLSHFIRMSAAGRLQEWYASHGESHGDTGE
jgi:hypothetical protein